MSRPQTWNDWADFFSKSVLGIAALGVTAGTAVITHSEKSRAEAEESRANAERELFERQNNLRQEEARERDNTRFIFEMMAGAKDEPYKILVAASYCNDPPRARMKSFVKACSAVAERGSNIIVSNTTAVRAAARSAVDAGDPKSFLNSTAAVAQNRGLAAAESAKPAVSTRWFAVVGTLPQTSPEAVSDLARQLNARLLVAGLPKNDVHVYRTKVSKSFALTSGLDKTKAEAQARARMLRNAGFTDAFAQPDREWARADELR